MWEIWAQWENGNVEHIDDFNDECEADCMVSTYVIAYGESAYHIWKQKI